MTEEFKKEKLGLVIIGHIDAGKSTLCGRLLVDSGGIDKRSMCKLEQEAVDMGRASFKYAFAMDLTKTERSRGITIQSTVKCFETERFNVTIVDAPGHKDFTKNMITGTCTAEVAILVIDGTPGGFEAGISSRGQTRQHAQLAFASGVHSMIVVVNKMDAIDEKDQEERFVMIRNEIANILKKIGYFKVQDHVPYMPIAAFGGRNVTDKNTCYAWHPKWKYQVVRKGQEPIHLEGTTVIDAINSIVKEPAQVNCPLRACVTDSFVLPGVGTIATLSVNYGKAEVGMPVRLEPVGQNTKIHSIEIHRVSYESVEATVCAGMRFKGMTSKELKRGTMVGPTADPPKKVKSFLARIVVFDHPTKISKGYSPVLDTNTTHVSCCLSAIHKVKESKRHANLRAELGEDAEFLASGDQAEVTFKPKTPLVIEALPLYPRYSRVSVRDSGAVVAIGSCIGREVDDVVDKQQKNALVKSAKAAKAVK